MVHELETWMNVKGYEGIYMASTHGNIKVLARTRYCGERGIGHNYPEKILKLTELKNKYLCITLAKNNKMHSALVHRVICETYHSNPFNLPCVNHKNGDRQDNRPENLEWCTRSYNMRHAYRMREERKKAIAA